MLTGISIALVVFFVAAALAHAYWALGGRIGFDAAIPRVAGRASLNPSRASTWLVAIALLVFAVLVAALAGFVRVPLSAGKLRWVAYALAAVLVLRAIGEFRLVGLFKSIRGSRFATLDTWLYSPLCLLLAAGIAVLAAPVPACTVTSFGIVERSGAQTRLPSTGATSGYQTAVEQQRVVLITSDIPARLGTAFGFEYRLGASYIAPDVTALVTHPPIRKPDGTVVNGFSSGWDPALTSIAYVLEQDNELVPGRWQLALESRGKTLCKKVFDLVPSP